MSQFIEFEVNDSPRFKSLQAVFHALKKDKDKNSIRPDEDWLLTFDKEALSHFHVPSSKERLDWINERSSKPILLTPTEETTGQKWDFFVMIDAFADGEYELLSCEIVEPTMARLEFNALAYPYGGVGCMVALIEAFGFRVSGIEDGTGYIKFK